jgi:hypothetical protein
MDPNLFQPVIPCVTLQCDRSKIVGNRDDYLVFTRDNSAWQSIYTYGATTLGVVNPNNFFFIFHARKKVGTQTSPWSEFVPLVDEAFPLALTPLPQDDPFPAGYGNRPLERISVRDDETRWYDQQGINAALSALIVSDGVTSTTTWYYKGGEYDLKINDEAREPYGGYHSTHTYTLLNQELLPPAFQTNVPLDFLFEFGDRASFKNTHAWTNTLPGYVGDGSGPNIVIGSVLGAWATGISRVKTGPLTPIAKDQTFDLRAVTLRDDESGIDWETVRIEECPGDGAGGVVGSCVDVLRYNPAVRPGGKKFGQYFEFWLPSEPDPAKRQTRLTSLATHAFHTPGFRILRISAENCNHIGGQTLWEFNVS